MESISSKNIKENFKAYSKENNFTFFESDSIKAPENSKLLFNISGGVKYQNELLGLTKSNIDRISSIQKCVRTDNMDSIGYSGRHHLFFEMMGHFMFYCANEKECKEEFVKFAYNYLVKEVGLVSNKLFVTVHPKDLITIDVWKKLNNSNIILNSNNFFVSPYADKSALRTEIKWQRPDEENSLVELWNLVFTQFDSKELFENQSFLIAADSGASLERITSAYENKSNNYENSMWYGYIKYIQSLTTVGNINLYRRIADFFNTSVMLIADGITPGNKTQAYTLRKIIRSLFDICDSLGINYEYLINEYLNINSISIDKNIIYSIFNDEYVKYNIAIQSGLIQAQKLIKKRGIENIDLEYLKSTCGLPKRYIEALLYGNNEIVIRKLSK